jgi:hypothetical protein
MPYKNNRTYGLRVSSLKRGGVLAVSAAWGARERGTRNEHDNAAYPPTWAADPPRYTITRGGPPPSAEGGVQSGAAVAADYGHPPRVNQCPQGYQFEPENPPENFPLLTATATGGVGSRTNEKIPGGERGYCPHQGRPVIPPLGCGRGGGSLKHPPGGLVRSAGGVVPSCVCVPQAQKSVRSIY